MGGICFFRFLLQRNSWAKKGGNVDQDIRQGLVFGKVTSLKDLMMFYLEENFTKRGEICPGKEEQ